MAALSQHAFLVIPVWKNDFVADFWTVWAMQQF